MDKFAGGDLSGILEKLMSDEKFGEVVDAVRSSISANAENGSNISSTPESAPVSAETVPTDSPVSMIPNLSPELMSKLPMIMSMLSGSDSGNHKNDSKLQDRKRLLQALKPFLSQSRKDAVDNIVNIAGIADLFGL